MNAATHGGVIKQMAGRASGIVSRFL